MDRVLFLNRATDISVSTVSVFFSKLMNKGNISTCAQYHFPNSFHQKLWRILGLVGYSGNLWLGDWKKNLSSYSIIIVCATKNKDVIKYLCKNKQPGQRIILWYWNPAFCCIDPELVKNWGCELWSFDANDCDKYNMFYNTTYYFKDLQLPKSKKEKVDVFFCGLSKGRNSFLFTIQNRVEKMQLVPYFHIVDEQLPIEEQKPRLSYQENLEYISSCKAVLDILQEGQDGMTLRVMEALFFQKKLITNQLSLVKADFYHPNNIFIIGKDDWNNLKSFMSTPIVPISEEIKYKYDFFSWVERFGEKVSL